MGPIMGIRTRSRALLRLALWSGAGLVAAMWWFTTTPELISSPTLAVQGFGELAGLAGAYVICVQVLMIARLPWVERAIGMDRLVGWHRTVGTSVILLVIVHVLAMVIGGELADGRNPVAEYVNILQSYPDILLATFGTLGFFAVGLSSMRVLRERMSYEAWWLLHVTTYVAIFLTFLHQVSAGTTFLGRPLLRAAWTTFYLAIAACVIVWRAGVPLWRLFRHDFRVGRIDVESDRVVSVWISGRDLDRMGVRPGNFLLFRFLARGQWLTAHPYSVSNIPAAGWLRITVGALGNHSGGLARLRPGTRVLVEGPFGTFTAERSRRAGALLIAGGAGIGPIRGLAEDLARMGRSVVVLYRASRADDLALHREFDSLQNVRLVALVGRRADLGYDPLSAHAIEQLVPDAARRDAFVCGPEGMTLQAFASLRQLGVPKRRLHAEELSFA